MPEALEMPIRVFFDTNVLLAAAFSRRSHVKDLLGREDVKGVVTFGVLDEVNRKLDQAAVNDDARLGAGLLVGALLAEHQIEVADVYVPSIEAGDLQHARAASALRCDWICTYDSDFSDTAMPAGMPPAATPLGLLRSLDPLGFLVESPQLGAAGTLVIMGSRQFGQSGPGAMLVSDNGTRVYGDTDGSVVVEAVGQQLPV